MGILERLFRPLDRLRRGRSRHGGPAREPARHGRPQGGRRRSPNEGWYGSASCRPLTVGQVRERQFRSVRRGGLDPLEVYAFLHRVAGELATARRELTYTAEENVRIKRALRSWQSHFAPRLHR